MKLRTVVNHLREVWAPPPTHPQRLANDARHNQAAGMSAETAKKSHADSMATIRKKQAALPKSGLKLLKRPLRLPPPTPGGNEHYPKGQARRMPGK